MLYLELENLEMERTLNENAKEELLAEELLKRNFEMELRSLRKTMTMEDVNGSWSDSDVIPCLQCLHPKFGRVQAWLLQF